MRRYMTLLKGLMKEMIMGEGLHIRSLLINLYITKEQDRQQEIGKINLVLRVIYFKIDKLDKTRIHLQSCYLLILIYKMGKIHN